jgi:PAS domain S-box-containing protein
MKQRRSPRKTRIEPGRPRQAAARRNGPTRTGDAVESGRRLRGLEARLTRVEQQNAKLLLAAAEAGAQAATYRNRYELAPVAYLALDREGVIRETNQAFAALVGMKRPGVLVNRRLCSFLAAVSLPLYSRFLRKTFQSRTRQVWECTLLAMDKRRVEVRMQASVSVPGRECRLVITDITERKQAEEVQRAQLAQGRRAEQELREARDQLELRVEGRTAELRESAARLRAAIDVAALGRHSSMTGCAPCWGFRRNRPIAPASSGSSICIQTTGSACSS